VSVLRAQKALGKEAMTIAERIEKLKALRIETTSTKAAVENLQGVLKDAQQKFEQSREDLNTAVKSLREAVQADARATAALMRAEAAARIAGYLDRVTG